MAVRVKDKNMIDGSLRIGFTACNQVVSPEEPFVGSLGCLYQKLSLGLEIIEEELLRVGDIVQKSCLVVFEDDLKALLEECEESLFTNDSSKSKYHTSLRTRAETVLEELLDFL